jgi:MFS family permease
VAVVLGTAALALTPGPLALLLVVALVAGNARGIFTLLQATAVSDRWGSDHYARLNGVFAAPLMIAGAVAPFVGSGLATLLGSYTAGFAILAVAGLSGAAVTLCLHTPAAHEAALVPASGLELG